MSKEFLAAPVSGQGASIGDTAEFAELLNTYATTLYTDGVAETTATAHAALIAYIDSHPRSEDSRAKVLEEAAQIADSVYQAATGRYAIGRQWAAFRIAKAIRALASTTPQKADSHEL